VARFNKELATWYPGDAAKNVKHAEAFEICEYGGQPNNAELRRLFPFFN
jgi:N-acetylglucosamine malate deacetylase 1